MLSHEITNFRIDSRGRAWGTCPEHPDDTYESAYMQADPLDEAQWECIACALAKQRGMGWRINDNGLCVVELDFWADPDKDPETEAGRKWYTELEASYRQRPRALRQEYFRDHDAQSGVLIYPEFSMKAHLRPDLEFDPKLELVACFDWGIVHPAAVFFQVDAHGRFNVLLEVLGFHTPITHFFTELHRLMELRFLPGWGLAGRDLTPDLLSRLQLELGKIYGCGDPAGNNRNSHGVSDIMFIQHFGWTLRRHMYSSPGKMIERVRALLLPAEDGQPRLALKGETFQVKGALPASPMRSDRPGTLLQGFLSGYQYRHDRRGALILGSEGAMPCKDIYSHLQDALSNGVLHRFRLETEQEVQIPHILEGRRDFVNLRRINNWDGQGNGYEMNNQLAREIHGDVPRAAPHGL